MGVMANGMIKDIYDVDCSDCQHKDVCKFKEGVGEFVRSVKGSYTESGANPFIVTVSCTHKKQEVPTPKNGNVLTRDISHEILDNTGLKTALTTSETINPDFSSSAKNDESKIVTRELK